MRSAPTTHAEVAGEARRQTGGVPRLPLACTPCGGESIRGYLHRLAARHGYTVIKTFLNALKLGSFGPESRDVAWDRLACATGQDASTFSPLRWTQERTPAGVGYRTRFLGGYMLRGFLRPATFRFCPACLQDRKLVRQFWDVAYVVACPRHGCLLVEWCMRCLRKASLIGRPWGCVCGAKYEHEEALPAPGQATRMAANLAAMIGTEIALGPGCAPLTIDLPAPFAGLPADEYMAVVHTIGVAATKPEEEDEQLASGGKTGVEFLRAANVPADTTIARIEAAHAIMDDWPAAYDKLLAQVERRSAGEYGSSPMDRAFSTRVGKSLRRPMRTCSGLPIALLQKAMDTYWAAKTMKVRRARSVTVRNAVARRICKHVNQLSLAKALGAGELGAWRHRCYVRVIDGLTDADVALTDEELAAVVEQRFLELTARVEAALSPSAAHALIDGGVTLKPLNGWLETGLLAPDHELRGLSFAEKEVYAPESIRQLLDKLSKLVVHLKEPGRLVSFTSVALRNGATHPFYKKADAMIDVFNGDLAVYAIVERPKLCDVLVDHAEIMRRSASRRPAALTGVAGFGNRKLVNDCLRREFGIEAVLSSEQFEIASNLSLVRCMTGQSTWKDKKRWVRYYNVEDVRSLVSRRAAGCDLTSDEMVMFTTPVDISTMVLAMRLAGRTVSSIVGELNRQGILTRLGATWTVACLRASRSPKIRGKVCLLGIETRVQTAAGHI